MNTIKILVLLEEHFPNAKTEINFQTPFQLLVATILSAQCTDARVNIVTPELFRRFPDAQAISDADIEEIKTLIRSTGFYNNKAKNIQNMAKMIIAEFNGCLPENIEDLTKLPGVARKTANVLLYNAFGKNEGIAVDTHVTRIANVLKLTDSKDPKKIEVDLMNQFPRNKWGFLSQSIVLYGRYICTARKHDQSKCFLGHP